MMIDEVVEKCKKHKQLILMIFLLGLFGYYLIWTISQPYNSCPDEGIYVSMFLNIILYQMEETRA